MKKLLGTCLAAAAICAFGFGSASAVNWQVFGQDSNCYDQSSRF